MATVRTSQTTAETVINADANVRVSQVVAEVLDNSDSIVRVSQVVGEVLDNADATVRISQAVAEVLTNYPVEKIFTTSIAGAAGVDGLRAGVVLMRTRARGRAHVNGVGTYFLDYLPTFPPPGPVTVGGFIPSYLYVEYNDDDSLQAMVAAYNAYGQAYVDWFNGLNLPIYTAGNISGTLLDWVATYLYGFPRPSLPSAGYAAQGPYNTFTFNSLPYNGSAPAISDTEIDTTDDIYKRCLTWLFFKGDGFQFTVGWLKRRLIRFLNGQDGYNVDTSDTSAVSVVFTGSQEATITLQAGNIATILKAALDAGVLTLPFQITWTVVIT